MYMDVYIYIFSDDIWWKDYTFNQGNNLHMLRGICFNGRVVSIFGCFASSPSDNFGMGMH